MNEIVVYTVMIGDYDNYNEIDDKYIENNVDYLYFTNDKNKKVKNYNMIYIDDIGYGNKMNQRYYKLIIHKYVERYKYSIYFDGNVKITSKLTPLLNYLKNYDIIVFNYVIPMNVYFQFLNKYFGCYPNNKKFIDLYNYYINDGWKDNKINSTNKFIIKKHNRKMKDFCDLWFKESLKVGRDEFTLLYCVYKKDIKIKIENGIKALKYFDVYWHRYEDVKKTKGFNKFVSPNILKNIKYLIVQNYYFDYFMCILLSILIKIVNFIYYVFNLF